MSKSPISQRPNANTAVIQATDRLPIVNNAITKSVKVSELFSAGCRLSNNNVFVADTRFGTTTNANTSVLAIGVASGNQKIVFGGNPSLASNNSLVTSFGDIYVSEPFVFRTADSDSDRWAAAASKINILEGTTNSFIHTDASGSLETIKFANSSSILVDTSVPGRISFSRTSTTEQTTNLALSGYWILNNLSDGAAGLSLSALDTFAVCPIGHNRDYGIGLVSENKTHVANTALSVWGNTYIHGTITTGNSAGTRVGLGLGTLAVQNSSNVNISGGSVHNVDLIVSHFASKGITDDAANTALYIASSKNIGIGVPLPAQKLEVAGRIKSTSYSVANTGGDGILGTMDTLGSYLVVRKASSLSTDYGIKLRSTSIENTIHYTEGKSLRFFRGDYTETLRMTATGRVNIGNSSDPDYVLQLSGADTAGIYSSMAIVNTGVATAASNIFFGNSSSTSANYITSQHYVDSSAANYIKIGIWNPTAAAAKEKIRINSSSTIEFKDANESTQMIWDPTGTVPELRISGSKVWHAGNDGTGSGCDADLLDGQHGPYYLSWWNSTNVPTISLSGDLTGSVSLATTNPSTSITLTAAVVDDSHNHTGATITGIADLVNDNVSASTILTKIKTVDGSGSGLDADTCDGQHLGTGANVQFVNITATGTLSETSDARLKENVRTLTSSLSIINNLRGVSFNKIDTPDRREIGLIAQEVEEFVPEVVETDEDGMKRINYPRLTALLIEAIKELTSKIK